MKMFPRASAHAERLWTNPSTKSVEAQKRLVDHTHRLSQRGVGSDAVQVSNLYILGVLPKIPFILTQSIHVALQKSWNYD